MLLSWADNAGKTITRGVYWELFWLSSYVSLITATKITEENHGRLKIDLQVLSRNAEAGGTLVAPMIPWTDGGVIMGQIYHFCVSTNNISYL